MKRRLIPGMAERERPEGLRYELKYVVEGRMAAEVRGLVRCHPALLVEAYPPRFVNNIYLDTPTLDYYASHREGASERHKVRIRWYGELAGEAAEPALEIKIKRGMVGSKERYPLLPLAIPEGLADRALARWLRGVEDLPARVQAELAGLRVSLVNRYHRAYFATHDGRYRVTIDSRMSYYDPRGGRLRRCRAGPEVVVLELKCGVEARAGADRIGAAIPFRLAQYSKYLAGVEGLLF